MISLQYRRWVAFALWGLILTACSKPRGECQLSETISLAFDTHTDLNHDRDGYARSVVVRVYQLEDVSSFEKVDVESLWQATELGGAAAGPDEFTLVPGRSQTESLKRRSKVLYLGLAANFREQPAPDSWKQIVQLPPAQDPCAGDEAPAPFKVGVSLANYTMRVR